MKILYLTTSCFDKGGIPRYSRYQIRALRELFGSENVRVLSLMGPDENSFEDDFETYWYGTGSNGLSKTNMILQATKTALLWKPQIIFSAHINLSFLGHQLAQLLGAKSILNTYGFEVWSGLSTINKKGLMNSHFVLSDCHFTAQYLEDENLRPKDSTAVIWDCADLNRFQPGEIPIELIKKYNLFSPKDHFVVMTLGRISKGARHKGYERLIEVFQKVVTVETNARLVFVGGGDFIDDLKKRVLKAGIHNKTRFTGRITENELTLIYRCASVFSLVSDRGHGRGEGIPLTPIEAMACGIPIIVGNHDGSQEAVDNNRNGWIIDPFDFEKHASVFINLATNKKLLASMKMEALNVVNERFSFETFKLKHKQLINNCLPGYTK